MDSEDEGGFLPTHQQSRPGDPAPRQHVRTNEPQFSGQDEPLYARVANKSTWSQRRGFSEPGPGPMGPRFWAPQTLSNTNQHLMLPNQPSSLRPLPYQPFSTANQISDRMVGQPFLAPGGQMSENPGAGQPRFAVSDQAGHTSLPGTFGVDTEMIEERWIHMQEARRRQQTTGTGSSHHSHKEQLAATYSPESARQIYIQRKDGGFGFTLRHFIVYPPEDGDVNGPPISEPMDTIFVKFIKEGGPATLAGLQVGDRLISVNSESVAGLTYAQVVQLIQNTKGMLRLVVVPEKDDILQVYFSEIAQDPKTNTRLVEPLGSVPPGGGGQHHGGGSGSSRDSSPFSSRASSDRFGGHHHQVASVSRLEHEPLYECVGGGSSSCVGSTEHVYATPALAGGSSLSTLGSGPSTSSTGKVGVLSSKDSLNSDSSLTPAQHPSQQDDQMIDKIKKDCEKKKEFLEKPTYPSYLSSGGQPLNMGIPGNQPPSLASPPKEVDSNPYGIASLANTMPPPREDKKEVKEEAPAAATKNFFMDIYAKELSKMQSASKSSAPTKKRNFDATQFNTYGRPLGYRSGGHFYETDSFSRNNFVIIGTRSLHCEPPNAYQRPPEPPPSVCERCYECHQPVYPYPTAVPGSYCPVCVPVHAVHPPGCLECASMTMSHPPPYPHHHHHHPQGPALHQHHHHPSPPPPARPSTLPGLKPDGGPRDSPPASRLVPSQGTPVHMHPDPSTVYRDQIYLTETSSATSPLLDSGEVVFRRSGIRHESEADRNLRRVSYLQATKDERMDTEENEGGIAPTHSIKKLKSIFSEKGGEGGSPTAAVPLTVKMGESSGDATPAPASSPKRKPSFDKAGSLTSMLTEGGGLKEGYLHCKVAVVDGKRATDRSWKSVYAVLKSKALYMYKDKKTAQENLEEFEEKPVKLAESEVEVANDYTKRKNVFRVKTEQGSEYLFQAENELLMKDWVKTIDEAAMAVIIDERKDNKLKKLASFRNRSPTGQSPSAKPRKPSGESLQPLVNKDKKNWKGKMVKQLKRMGGGGGQGGVPPSYPEGGSIGVPLEECPLASEFTDTDLIIPYLVKICCDIVTERGLEIVGIYRVPGNNAAVNYLTEQINKGVPFYQLDDTRWQDVNVVSSLLKLFFRKLPDPLFTMEMYGTFIEASKIEQPGKRLEHLRRLVRDLPEIHQETLKFLTKHLCSVADNSSTNKMEIRNLAIVFGPTLVRTTDDNMVTMVTDMSQQCRIIESLLSNWEYFFADTEVELEVRDSDLPETSMEVTGTSNHQSVMLANLHKLEDAGKLSSPKGDVSAKDIMSSIISAANRKMKKTGKKESSGTDLDELANSSGHGKLDELPESRRDSESVIHGALQIASAVPGILGPFSGQSLTSGSRGCSSPPTPSEDSKPFSSRRNSRDSYSGGSSDGLKRRGSLPAAPHSKRGSICSYTAVVTSSSSGVTKTSEHASLARSSGNEHSAAMQGVEHMVEEPIIIQSDTEAIRNGMDENQVIRGTLSLVNVTSSKREVQVTETEHSYPFHTYTGLQEAQTQRIKQFEAETKAMIHRSVEQSSSRNSIDEQMNKPEEFGVSAAGPNFSQQRSFSTGQLLTSITTPVPDTDPLTGGILLEDHYHTDAYDRIGLEATYLPQYRPSTISSMLNIEQTQQAPLPPEILKAFDTNKVAKRGTLQRLKVRRVEGVEEGLGVETVMEASEREEAETDKDALGQLSATFDEKLKFLLDPGPSSVRSQQSTFKPSSSRSFEPFNSERSSDSDPTDTQQSATLYSNNFNPRLSSLDSASNRKDDIQQQLDDEFVDQMYEFVTNPGSKKELDDVRNNLLRNTKVRRGGRVDKSQADVRRGVKHGGASSSTSSPTSSKSQLVLRQINNRKPLKRSDSLTKKEKTELNLKTKEVEKENKVMKLKEQFEAKSIQSQAPMASLITQPVNNKLDVNRIRKKLSDSRNNRIKRRHTVGGTKDFPDKLMNKVNQEDLCWDRLVPALSVQEVKGGCEEGEGEEDDSQDRLTSLLYRRLEDFEERRLSLPDYGGLVDPDRPIESHV